MRKVKQGESESPKITLAKQLLKEITPELKDSEISLGIGSVAPFNLFLAPSKYESDRVSKALSEAPEDLGKLCKIRNFSQSPFGGFIFEESDGNFPSGRNWSEPNQSVSSLIDTIILGEANLGSIFEAISDEHVGNRGQHC